MMWIPPPPNITAYTDLMINADLKDLWIPTGLLLGFQVTFFKWRLEREAGVGDDGDIPWLVPADDVSIAGMLSFVLGVILLPVAGLAQIGVARWAFGLGHYSLLGKSWGWPDTTSSSTLARNDNSCGFRVGEGDSVPHCLGCDPLYANDCS